MIKNHVPVVCPMMAVLMAAMLSALWTAHADIPPTVNHQGVVKVGTTPFTGTGLFRFAIKNGSGLNVWTNDGSGLNTSQMPTNAVSLGVANGIYNVRLGDTASYTNMVALAQAALAAAGLSLRVWFSDGVHGVQELTPAQPLSSVPFAYRAGDADMLGGKPAWHYPTYQEGSFIQLNVEGGLNVSSDTRDALDVIANEEGNSAIKAESTGDESNCIQAKSYGVNGRGVYAEANDADGTGVYGGSSGANGTGVHASVTGANGRGIYASATGASGKAVQGVASSTATGTNYGGQFEAGGTQGRGVHAKATGSAGRGLYTEATGTNGRGVYAEVTGGSGVAFEGFSGGANGYGAQLSNDYSGNNVDLAGPDNAGYFQGDVVTTDDYKYSSAKTYYKQIPATTFEETIDFYNVKVGTFKMTIGDRGDDPPPPAYVSAAVDLPQGANIQSLTIYYYDNDSDDALAIDAYLYQQWVGPGPAANTVEMAAVYITTNGTPDVGEIRQATDTSIAGSSIVNNTNAQYIVRAWLSFDTNRGGNGFYGARIGYTLDTVAP